MSDAERGRARGHQPGPPSAAGVVVTEVGEDGRPLAARVDPPTEELIQRLRDDAAALLSDAFDDDLGGCADTGRALAVDVRRLLARLTLSISSVGGDATHPSETRTRRVTCWERGDGRLADGWVGVETRERGGVHSE